ncbi:MAG: hypothetical protein Kow00108_16600 [Calditrichia bacterium]
MKRLCAFMVAALFILVTGCSDSTSSNGDKMEVLPKLSSIQQEVFNTSCAFSSCHGGAVYPTLVTGQSYGSLVQGQSQGKPGEIFVIPGNSNDSYLIKKLKGFSGTISGEQMPKGSAPLSNAVIDSIAKWIDLGAENN